MYDSISNVFLYFEHLGSVWYILLFLSVFFESIFLIWYVIPWTTVVIIFWMLAGLWYYDIGDLLFLSILWNVLWSIVSFYVWKHFWKNVFKKWFYFIKPNFFYKSKSFIDRYGWRSILFWKLVPALKENIPFVAWLLQISFPTFLFWNILWWILWSFIYIWIWYVFYSSFELAKIWAWRIGLAIIFIFIIVIIFTLIRIYTIKLWNVFFKILKSFIKYIWNKFKNVKFMKKHPKLLLFIENRFLLDKFTWLPLTVLLWIFLYLVSWVIWFTELTFDNFIMKNIDINTSYLMYYFYNIILVKIFIVISFFWNFYFILIMSLFLSYYFFITKRYNILFSFLTTISTTSIITGLMKYILHRPRPDLATYFVNSYSFPSFHSSISVAFYWFIAWLLIRKIKKINEKVNILIAFIIIAFVIWFSRIYLNVHYVSDVLWWYLVWFIWLIFWITIFEYVIHINKEKEKKYKHISKFSYFLLIILSIFISWFYFLYYFNTIKYLHPKYVSNTVDIKNVLSYLNNHPNLKYTETITWRKTEPINFIFLAKSDKDLIILFKKAWFIPADRITFESIVKIWTSLYDKKPYYTAPMLPLYWNNKIQNFNFQKVINPKNIRLRHHIRIWKTNLKQWDYHIYVWCWIYDNGIKWHITHKIAPDIDVERNYIFNTLKKSWFIGSYKLVQLVKSYLGYNFSYDVFFTDGKAYLIEVK